MRSSSKIRAIRTICTLVLFFSGSTWAGNAGFPEWLAGHWCLDAGDEQMEELWLPAVAGESMGLSRTKTGGRTVGFEFLRITESGGRLNYVAQPGGRPPTTFAETVSEQGYIRFENPDHDFPQAIDYRRTARGIEAAIEGPADDGGMMRIPFTYQPCKS